MPERINHVSGNVNMLYNFPPAGAVDCSVPLGNGTVLKETVDIFNVVGMSEVLFPAVR